MGGNIGGLIVTFILIHAYGRYAIRSTHLVHSPYCVGQSRLCDIFFWGGVFYFILIVIITCFQSICVVFLVTFPFIRLFSDFFLVMVHVHVPNFRVNCYRFTYYSGTRAMMIYLCQYYFLLHKYRCKKIFQIVYKHINSFNATAQNFQFS